MISKTAIALLLFGLTCILASHDDRYKRWQLSTNDDSTNTNDDEIVEAHRSRNRQY
uniref:Uncharacterized protein n=1 Tax=Panagrolaimus sp. PS1159 TaxID=55785 RepID=A0AC35GWV0_9BILA